MSDYTNPALVSGMRETERPHSGQTVSGYGARIPTRYMLRYAGIWRRVYVMVYGNAGSAYVNVKGKTVFLDSDTEHRMEGM